MRRKENSAQSDRTLIVGLGNPGSEYAHNRHNIGFRCIDHLAQQHGVNLSKRRFKAVFGEDQIADTRVILAKPQTFMNKSGQAVGPLSRWYKIPVDQVLVIHDDLDLDFGRIRLRPEGSSGGHNGIKSIISALGSQSFPRVRIGIGRPKYGDPVDYVLNDFDSDQAPYVPDICERVEQAVMTFLRQGIREAMNMYNGLEPVAPPAE